MSTTNDELAPPHEQAPPQPSVEGDPELERVRKVFVKNLRPNDRVHTVFLVTRKQRNVSRSGKPFLALSLADKTGELDARIFEEVDRADSAFQANDYLLVRGQVITFQKRHQLVIEALERLDPEPLDPNEFQPPPKPEPASSSPSVAPGGHDPEMGTRAVQQIRELVERVEDRHIRQLLLAFLDDPAIAAGLPRAPAAKGIHHAYHGGLAEHLLSVLRLAHRVADHYPMADRDLLVAGALLHDIGKVKELSYSKNFEYTDEGRLVGHLVITAQMIREKTSRIEGFPPLLEHHLTHLVLAHHGQLEYGSPKLPMTLEALLVHLIGLMDSRVASWLELMAKDPGEKWTEPSKLYDRSLWKGPVPTARNRSPIDGRSRRSRDRGDRRRGRNTERGPRPDAPRSAPAIESRPTLPPRDPSLPSELSFKPFTALMGDGADTSPEPNREEGTNGKTDA